jgi:hypothetical protein
VEVGPDTKKFFVYNEVACHHSRYFRAIFDREGGFKETESRVIHLTDVSTRVFGHFPEWLEKQTLDHVEDHLCLLNLYIMAERLETPVRQNLIVDKLYRRRLNEFNDVDMFNGATSTD